MRLFKRTPKPEPKEAEFDAPRPAGFVAADEMNDEYESGNEEEMWDVWKTAYEQGIVLDVNTDLDGPFWVPQGSGKYYKRK